MVVGLVPVAQQSVHPSDGDVDRVRRRPSHLQALHFGDLRVRVLGGLEDNLRDQAQVGGQLRGQEERELADREGVGQVVATRLPVDVAEETRNDPRAPRDLGLLGHVLGPHVRRRRCLPARRRTEQEEPCCQQARERRSLEAKGGHWALNPRWREHVRFRRPQRRDAGRW